MYLADYHTHTRLSPDSQAEAADMIAAARAAGLRELCLTDHLDFVDFNGNFVRMGDAKLPFYSQDFVRSAGGARFTLRSGVELGEAWEDPDLAREVYACPGLDFVIGSVHNLSLKEGGVDFYFTHFDCEETCHGTLRSYFDCMEALCRMDCYDVLGHIIYPLRYMNDRDGNHVTLERYIPQLRRIFQTAAAKGKGIEVNTHCGDTVAPWREVLSLYRDCGGSIVTLGSDAHAPEDVAGGIRQGAELLKELGFDLAVYENHRPKLIQL